MHIKDKDNTGSQWNMLQAINMEPNKLTSCFFEKMSKIDNSLYWDSQERVRTQILITRNEEGFSYKTQVTNEIQWNFMPIVLHLI
jgi:hypothetical protein